MIKLLPLNFSGYELPVFKESRKGDWIEYGTQRPWKNTYPDYLTKLYNESSKHNTIINGKVNFIVGQGFSVNGQLTFMERAEIDGFLRTPNEHDTMNELLTKIVKDKKVYGGFCIQVRVNAKKKIVALNHIDFGDIRIATEEGCYYYTDDWKARNPENNDDYKKLYRFPFDDTITTKKDYLIYYKEYRPELGEYPLPDYVACIPYLNADAEIANFTLQNIKNNLSVGYIVSFNNGEPTEEEMKDIEYRFKQYATGTDNAGKPLLSFTDQNSDHPQIIPIPVNGQDERFINLNKQIREEIFTAHAITSPLLFGVKDTTGWGNNADELRSAAELYQNLIVDPEQKTFNQLFNEILAFNGLPKALTITKVEPIQKPFSEADIGKVMTPNEIREQLGLPPLEDGQRILMHDEQDEHLFNQLKEFGYRDSELEVLKTFQAPICNMAEANDLEDKYLKNYSFALDRVLTVLEKNILSILKDNKRMPISEIVKALDIEAEVVNETLQNLQNVGALDRDFIPTQEAIESIQKPLEKIFVVYKYIKRPDALPLVGGMSRPFCRQMLALNRLYTLKQLESLTNDFGQTGLDIFTKRGGWYTIPRPRNILNQPIDLDEPLVHRPFCRHIWEQQIVRLKT